jgi:hypothetical protein
MSVWKSACYRDDALQWYLRSSHKTSDDSVFVRSLCDFEIGTFGNFPVPEGVQPGKFRDCYDEDFTIVRRVQASDSRKPSRALTALAEDFGPVEFGITAVYRIANHILERASQVEDEAFEDSAYLEHLTKFGFAASSHSAKDYDTCQRAIKYLTSGAFRKAKKGIRELVRLRGYFKTSSYAAEVRDAEGTWDAYPEIENPKLEILKSFKVYSFPGAVLLRHKLTDKSYLLLNNDIERIDKICTGIHLSHAYLLAYGEVGSEKHSHLILAFSKMVSLFMGVAKTTTQGNKVCRAFDVAYHYVLAVNVGVDDERAAKEQSRKFADEGLAEVISLSEYARVFSGLAPKELLEVAMFYKCLPQPDFDYFSAAFRQREMYMNNQATAILEQAAQGEIFEGILLYHKWTMLYAFWKAHGHCPGIIRDVAEEQSWHQRYPHVKPVEIDYTQMNDIDFHGDFSWKGRTTDIIDLVNDKATCPKNLKDHHKYQDLTQMSVKDRNQLVDVMMRDEPINLEALGADRASLNYDVKADDKPESKKPNGRWFLEAMTEPRLKQSEYEDSISHYAKHVVGCFSGKSHSDKVRQMNAVTETIPDGVPYMALFVSFDIEKFSPYLPIHIHRKLDAQWAEAFGVPDLNEASRIFSDGYIHYIKGCVHHKFRKFGVDFEGFAGKKLTIYHCAVMGYVARHLRINGITNQPCRFAALIDDGLLRVVLPIQNFAGYKRNALRIIETIYRKAALRISWDKTYASCLLAVFLHEIRIAGRSLTPGLRAVLKVSNRADVPNPSMLDDLLHLRSTVSGAIVAGATPVASYLVYAYHVYDLVKKWAPKHEKVRHAAAVNSFLPIQLGGLGVESMNSLGGSISHTQLADSLGRLKLIGIRYPGSRQAITQLLQGKMRGRTGVAELLNPGGLVTTSIHLRNDRLQIAIEKTLTSKITAPVFQALVPVLEAESTSILNTVLASGNVIPVPLREALFGMTPDALVRKISAKFLRARSAKALVKMSRFRRINYANIRDAESVLKSFVR